MRDVGRVAKHAVNSFGLRFGHTKMPGYAQSQLAAVINTRTPTYLVQ
jgi:hypothetical protein